VIYSLFQEQIELEALELDEALAIGSERFAESITYFPRMEYAGPREHIMWVERTRKAVGMPLFGSLNATSMGAWVEYAKQLESAGCDGLELNLYAVETDPGKPAAEIEKRSLEAIAAVKSDVRIPVAVKLSPFYTSVANFAREAVGAGADGLVLFNRFYQPMIDPDSESLEISLDLSTPEEIRLALRWIAILSGQIGVDLAASTGVHSGRDVVRQLLAGARVTQTVSALLKNGIGHIANMNREISQWMDARGYASIDEFRRKLNQRNVSDPFAFERAQYIKLLLHQGGSAGVVPQTVES
jgi:dihydroorotate dehydrogenase (fumarate)